MTELSVDYIKEKARSNFEIIRILSLLAITTGVGSFAFARDLYLGLYVLSPEQAQVCITFLLIFVILVLSLLGACIILYLDSERLLNKLKDLEP